MNAQTLRSFLPVLQEELILNMSYESGEHYGVLAMLAKQEDSDSIVLWEISNVTDAEAERDMERRTRRYRRSKTNRQNLKENNGGSNSMLLEAIELGDYKLSVSSATGSNMIDECNDDKRVQFIYLLQKGLQLGRLEEVPIERLRLNRYEMQEVDIPDFSKLDISKIPIKVKLADQHMAVLVNKRLSLQTGEYSKPRLVTVKGEEDGRIYIHGVKFYDIWKEAETRFEDERYKERFSEEELARIKKGYMENLPQICPKGSVIPIIEYESEQDYQAQFYTMDYLRSEPEHRSKAILMMFRPEQKIGPLGYRNRACALEAVEKSFAGTIAVELFMYYKRIPGEMVLCTTTVSGQE